jgi:uncharacterized protein YcbX
MKNDFYISELFIYPIKGLSGIKLTQSQVTERGFMWDRRWMLVDEQNQFISQRTFPQLCQFKLNLLQNGFNVNFDGESIFLPFEIKDGYRQLVNIWNDEVMAIEAPHELNVFFASLLKINCKLVYMPSSSNRLVDKNYVENDYQVSFADGYPILIIGRESLNLLNEKLEYTIPMNQFRPNIVFEGGSPHIEDTWDKIVINNVELKGVKPCGRCKVITINQETATSSKEPLKTLATYRNFDNKINFGQNTIVVKAGNIATGDKIIII